MNATKKMQPGDWMIGGQHDEQANANYGLTQPQLAQAAVMAYIEADMKAEGSRTQFYAELVNNFCSFIEEHAGVRITLR